MDGGFLFGEINMYNGVECPLLNAAYHEWDFEMKRIEREYTDKSIKNPIGCHTPELMALWDLRYTVYWRKRRAATDAYLAEVDRILGDEREAK